MIINVQATNVVHKCTVDEDVARVVVSNDTKERYRILDGASICLVRDKRELSAALGFKKLDAQPAIAYATQSANYFRRARTLSGSSLCLT